MPSVEHPSVATATPGTYGRRALHTVPQVRNYKVAHQKVSIDVDFENNVITGQTELYVIPTEPVLKMVKLDCRNLEVIDVQISINQNASRRAMFVHEDPFKKEFLEFTQQSAKHSTFKEPEQHHFYKNKNKRLFSGENTEELVILMPDKLKLTLQDSSTINPFTPSFKDSPGSVRAGTASEMTYTPVTIKIEYRLQNPKQGLHFVGGKGSNIPKSEWHVYTTNSTFGASTSSWVPCIDSLWEKPNWDIEISLPQTSKDIGVSKLIGSDYHNEQSTEDDDYNDDSNDIVVIGGDFNAQKENPHPIDLSKKVVSFSVSSPSSAHHVGWAAGPFVQRQLLDLKEEEEADNQEEKDTTAIPSAVYCLPSQERDALNTTIFLYKAIDFYSREFGSFPFTSNALVFVSDIDVKYCGFSGLTVLNKNLLYSPDEIEPIYESTYTLSVAIAEQWSGIYVVPATYKDLWSTVGISHYMALHFIKKLMGVNEYKYRIKKQADKVCDEDIGKRPLSNPLLKYPVSAHDLDFLVLKSPIVLFILDRRMTKTDKSFGLFRVIPKIFLQLISGDLPGGSLSTDHFQHICEKVNHNRLDSFFKQWVNGAGVPIFRVTQRFNKKRMFIEMGIRQVQQKETENKHLSPETFISNAKDQLEIKDSDSIPLTLFTGPMTIRIHEADGTPYEHIVDLKEGFTKLDIQYNTKYKRLKRSQKQLKTEREQREAAAEEDENILLHCLGDNLQTEKDIKHWNLTEWTKEEEDKMTNEAFEWIRVDADFEWICKIYINQPDYMYSSQLQQDRDVEAQLESIAYFSNSNPSPLYSTILLRTLMDDRYYYGVRVEAAYGMAKFAKENVDWIGSKHLLMAFKELFCFPNSTIPSPNNFQDFPLYFIKKAIPLALSTVKDIDGNCPLEIKKVLLNILRYNQNLDNPFSDTYYIGHLIGCLVSTLISNPLIDKPELLSEKDSNFLEEALAEVSRHQKLEEWMSSSSTRHVSAIALKEKVRLMRRGLFKFDPEDLLNHTTSRFTYDTRVIAFEGLFAMGALKNEEILKYYFLSLTFDQSLDFKHQLIRMFSKSLGYAVVEGVLIDLDEDELTKEVTISHRNTGANGFIVVEDGAQDQFESRRDAAARATVKGAIELLRRDYATYGPLRKELWNTVRQPLLNVLEKRDLYEVLEVLIQAVDTLPVKLDMPRERKIKATRLGGSKVMLKREAPFKLTLPKKILTSSTPGTGVSMTKGHSKTHSKQKLANANHPAHRYRPEIIRTKAGPLRYVKITRKTQTITVSSNPLDMSGSTITKPESSQLRKVVKHPHSSPSAPRLTSSTNTPKPKLKLKLKKP